MKARSYTWGRADTRGGLEGFYPFCPLTSLRAATCQTARPRWLSWEYKQRTDDRAAEASIMSLLTPCFCSLVFRLLDSTPSGTFAPDRSLFLDLPPPAPLHLSPPRPFVLPSSAPFRFSRPFAFLLCIHVCIRVRVGVRLLRPSRSTLFQSVLPSLPTAGPPHCRHRETENVREILIPPRRLRSRISRA